MITRLGEMSLSDVLPLLREMQAALASAQGIAISQLEAQLAGIGNVLAAITVAPPALGATITAALETVAQLQAAVSGPTVTLQANALLALQAQLEAQLEALTISIAIPDANVSAYLYTGAKSSIGAELQAAIDADLPGSGTTYALILATTSQPAWVAVGEVFRTS
jgi:hypothetical protein